MVWVPTGGPVGLHHDGTHDDPGVVAARTCALLLFLGPARLPGSWAGPSPLMESAVQAPILDRPTAPPNN